jgi:uncharacterized membrane protein (UPF0127 family)
MLASKAKIATTFVSRLIGLLHTPSLSRGEGLYIAPCNQIHMFGMKYAIDVVFLDRSSRVAGVCHSIEPGQISSMFNKAHACVELPSGIIRDTATEVGDEIEVGKSSEAPSESEQVI